MQDADAAQVTFGTSGLRGPADGFTPRLVAAHVQAFLGMIGEGSGDTVYLGADLRASSPAIAERVARAASGAGWQVRYGGTLPTPAIAAFAMARHCPAIMVTGSHIPGDRNGMKFYRPDGEFLKSDEAPVRAAAARTMAEGIELPEAALPDIEPAIARAYVERYVGAFAGDALAGLKIGIDLHSAAGGHLLAEVLAGLGAECRTFNQAKDFVAVDTEALDPDTLARARTMIADHGLDAVVSTDGDGDRPLLIDENGRQVNGDVLCALAARAIGIERVVTPLTSTSAIEMSKWFAQVERTRIGSPYVVAAMAGLPPGPATAGFEANGGFLLGSDIVTGGGRLAALPTRDAVLPLVSVLAAACARSVPVSALAGELPSRVVAADRVRNVDAERALTLLDGMARSATIRAGLDRRLAEPVAIDTRDGVRLTLPGGEIVHFRQSGNAPETRCYVETGDRASSGALLAAMMAALVGRLEKGEAVR